ncbi:LPS export ABC transporter periplasmic protein LptC [Lysobacter sp. GCM10012299]|jgi:lipopolysaccharide export system protein LptC|uniref:LPS export ABC transporter periplasmic protein LptC n=1 Tax=Lysobacter sp. GCM10012299 TaxID=3317333 RepID=UPI003613673B
MTRRGVAIFVLLLIGAVLSTWALWSQRDHDTVAGGGSDRPDYTLHDFELTVLDVQGKEAFTLIAPKMERDPKVKTLDIATPLFVIPPKAGSKATPWEVRSQTGWVSEKGEEVRLRGGVKAQSTNADGKPVSIVTDHLNVFPDGKRATSTAAVTVTQPGFILNGQGLEADLDAKRILLKSNVKARYDRSVR